MTDTDHQGADTAVDDPRLSARRRRRASGATVLALAIASAIGGALAGCHPTGTRFVDPMYAALFAAFVTFVSSRASRETLLVFTAVAVVMSRSWLEVPAALALLVAFFSVFPEHSRRRVGALVGALGVQALLRWSPVVFSGATAVVAGATLVPLLASAYRRIPRVHRRRAIRAVLVIGAAAIVLSIPAAVAVALVRADTVSGQRAAQVALDDVSNGSSASATSELRTAKAEFEAASSKLGSWWASVAALVPVVAQQRQALASGAATARDLVAAAEREAPVFNLRALRYHKGQVDVGRISAMLGPARRLDRSLVDATDRLGRLQSPWLVGAVQSRLRSFDQRLQRATASTELAVKAIPLMPGMLGADGPRHYFLAFVTPSESRGLDGILGAYGELTAVNGHLSLTVSGPDESLNAALPLGGGTLTGPADYLARYGQFGPASFFQDVTFSPDFPSVADVISQLYPQAGGERVDGVLMVDPYGLARLLSITGPVAVPGFTQPLTSRNAASILLKGQYLAGAVTTAATQNARHDLLQNALHITFQRLVNGSLPGPGVLSRQLEPAVLSGRIAFWSAHRNEVSLVHALHLADAFPRAAGSDLLAVTVQNAGANKIDAYLHESTTDRIVADPETGNVRAYVGISLHNDAPASGLPPIVISSPDAPATPMGADYCWMSIYSPLSLGQAAVNGRATTLTAGRELGVNVYSGWVLVPSRSTTTLAVSLRGAATPGSNYLLHVHLQPMANPATFRATFASSASGSSSGSGSSWTAGPEADQVHVFRAQ